MQCCAAVYTECPRIYYPKQVRTYIVYLIDSLKTLLIPPDILLGIGDISPQETLLIYTGPAL